MWVRNDQASSAADRELVASADKWSLESEPAQTTDQLSSRYRVHQRDSGDARHAQCQPLDSRQIVAELKTGDHPIL